MLPTRAGLALPFVFVFVACAPHGGERAVPPGGGETVLFTGAGDIGVCERLSDDSTAALLDGIGGVIWTTGDNAYPSGSVRDFEECYDPSWGRHRHRTRPVPGNHEYWTPGARPYFAYFGDAAGEAGKGWYSYRYGGWLVVALNSNLPMGRYSEQIQWLRKLLTENPSRCTVAYMHHPLVSSGAHGDHDGPDDRINLRPVWTALYRAGVELVLAGHDHHYERFTPMTPRGRPDPDRGIRQFIVGTGGGVLREPRGTLHPLSEVVLAGHHGVLRLTLGPAGYVWEFVDVAGGIRDQGEGRCH
jgi:hypothetical protein